MYYRTIRDINSFLSHMSFNDSNNKILIGFDFYSNQSRNISRLSNGKLYFSDMINFSTNALIERYFNILSSDSNEYIDSQNQILSNLICIFDPNILIKPIPSDNYDVIFENLIEFNNSNKLYLINQNNENVELCDIATSLSYNRLNENINCQKIFVRIKGPDNSPYKNRWFDVELSINNYPFKMPVVKFITNIIHINIGKDGVMNVNFINPIQYTPAYNLITIVEFIIHTLEFPNIWNISNIDNNSLFFTNRSVWNDHVYLNTHKNAIADPTVKLIYVF
jgi:ubiquitin-protein ligase